MNNQIRITYKYEEDFASTKQLLEMEVQIEGGKIGSDHQTSEYTKSKFRVMLVNFPTIYRACWFLAKLTQHMSFIDEVDAHLESDIQILGDIT